MAERSFGEEATRLVVREVAGKAVMWGPAIAGALLLGPVGILVGLATSVAIVTSCCNGGSSTTTRK